MWDLFPKWGEGLGQRLLEAQPCLAMPSPGEPASEPSRDVWNFLALRSRGCHFVILIFPPRRHHL